MKIAYLLFAYKNPRLMSRIIQRLSCNDCSFFIHIDEKSDIDQFRLIRGKNIFFTEQRIRVYWAEFSGVRAIQALMRQALAALNHYDYLVLLSGSEYPLRSREYIHNFLEANSGTQFINLVKMPNAEAGKPLARITTLRFPRTRPAARFLFRVLAKFGWAQRDYKEYLGELQPCGGNTWWALTSEASQYILDFDARNPFIAKYFENVFAPEEYFIHTVLGNSPFNTRLRRSLVYEDWCPGAGHPAMISEKHVAYFETVDKVTIEDVHGPGELLFARKFSDDTLDMADRIDIMIAEKERKCPV